MWLFIGCGLRDLVPLVGRLSVLVTVRVYAGGPSAIVFLLGYFLVVWFVAQSVWNYYRSEKSLAPIGNRTKMSQLSSL